MPRRRWQLANCFPRAKRYARARIVLFHLRSTPLWHHWIFNCSGDGGCEQGTSSSLSQRHLGYPLLAASRTSLSASQTVRIDWNFTASVARQFSRMRIDDGTSPWSRIWRDVPLKSVKRVGLSPESLGRARLPRNVEVFENAKRLDFSSDWVSVYLTLPVSQSRRLADVSADHRVKS